MPDQPNRPAAHDAHARHDHFLIAALAGDDLTPPERAAATELVATCSECAELLADLRSIMAATATLPAPARVRDFRLTEEDARRLRPGGWRQLIRVLAGPRLAFTQPLAAGLTTLGVAGLLLFSIQGIGSSGAARLSNVGGPVGPSQTAAEGATSAPAIRGAHTPAPGASGAAGEQSGAGSNAARASAQPSRGGAFFSGASSAPDRTKAGGQAQDSSSSPPTEPGGTRDLTSSSPGGSLPPLLLLSALAVLIGVALLAVRWTARSLTDA